STSIEYYGACSNRHDVLRPIAERLLQVPNRSSDERQRISGERRRRFFEQTMADEVERPAGREREPRHGPRRPKRPMHDEPRGAGDDDRNADAMEQTVRLVLVRGVIETNRGVPARVERLRLAVRVAPTALETQDAAAEHAHRRDFVAAEQREHTAAGEEDV